MKRLKKKPRTKTIKAAAMVAAGMSRKDVAEQLGVSKQTITQAVSNVLQYEEFENIRQCRMVANARLDEFSEQLRAIAGLRYTDGKEPAKSNRGEPPARVAAVRALIDIERRRAEMFGYDAPKRMEVREADPLENMTPEEVLASCNALNIPIPAGLAEECATRQRLAARARLVEDAASGSQTAG